MIGEEKSHKRRKMARLQALKTKYQHWEPHFRELATNILPRRMFTSQATTASEFDRGDRINDEIINNTPAIAARILASGMMAGITSPARRWFQLTTPDPEMAEFGPVRSFLHICEERIRWAMSLSNLYQTFADGVYPDLGVFGVSCDLLDAHPRTILRGTSLPIGEYYLATNSDGVVDTIYRELPMTVRQVVQKFGLPNVSERTRRAYDKGDYEVLVDVVHAIEPNEDYAPGRANARFMKFSSCWWERQSDSDEKFLRKSGYEEFPALVPRWTVRGQETYGRSPGMDALGDCKALQHQERKLADLVDKSADPPMKGSEGLRGNRASLLPGDLTYLPRDVDKPVFEPAIQVESGAIQALLEHIRRHEERIDSAFFADLWLRVLNDDRQQRATAREIEEAHQETMLQLGPVLERLNSELLRPCVDRFFHELQRRGFIPEPPDELADGAELNIEFISVMHQAQKAVGLGAVRTLIDEVARVSTLLPDTVDKINADEVVDEIASMAGVAPDLLNSDERVAEIREARRQAEAARAQGEAMLAASQGMKNLGTTPAASSENALGNVLQQLSPIAGGGLPT